MIRAAKRDAFTLIELLIVMAIIIVLASLVLMTSSYAQKKGARSRAEAEIAALSAALESYKADNGTYPTDPSSTETLNPATSPVPPPASKFLYAQLSGDTNFDGAGDSAKTYMPFKPANLQRINMSQPVGGGNLVTAIRDPFGNPYGYSTAKAAHPSGGIGFNPTFDLWSTAATTGVTTTDQAQWIKNW